MESNEPQEIELNILIFARNQEMKKDYEEGFQKLSKEFPKIHNYFILDNFEEEIQKLKAIKLDIVTSSPFFSKNVEYVLQNFPTIKWLHSTSAGIERYLKLDII